MHLLIPKLFPNPWIYIRQSSNPLFLILISFIVMNNIFVERSLEGYFDVDHQSEKLWVPSLSVDEICDSPGLYLICLNSN